MLIAIASIVLFGLAVGAFFAAPMVLFVTLVLVVWSLVDGLVSERLFAEILFRTILGVVLLQASYLVGLFIFGWSARSPLPEAAVAKGRHALCACPPIEAKIDDRC